MQLTMDDSFQLKADFIPLTVLKLCQQDLIQVRQQLELTIKKAPNYLKNAPILIELTEQDNDQLWDLSAIVTLLKEKQLIPIGIRGCPSAMTNTAHALGLAHIKTSAATEKKNVAQPSPKKSSHATPTKVITKPLRAGTQVYAKGGDLLILAGVNPGAECFADGNIHIYGPLRGRALAGVSGDQSARIFCKTLDAELIAVAGHYQVKEYINPPVTENAMIQIFLNNQKLTIDTI